MSIGVEVITGEKMNTEEETDIDGMTKEMMMIEDDLAFFFVFLSLHFWSYFHTLITFFSSYIYKPCTHVLDII